MDRPNGDIDVTTDDIDRWYFFPYTEYDEYEDSDPLYAIVAVFEDVGDVVVYNRPGQVGTYHTTDPDDTTPDIYPPSEEFKIALTNIITNPGESVDISKTLPGIRPWEHHQLDILLSGLNKDPEMLPVEIRAMVNSILTEMKEVEIKGGSATDTEFSAYMERSKEFYYEATNNP